MRWIAFLVCSAALTASVCSAQTAAKPTTPKGAAHLVLPPVPKALLPEAFSGWEAEGAPKLVTDPAQADSANAAALKEYDFTDGVLANYKRGSETLSLRALRFHDASGAYGAYSFYRPTGWPKEEIGSGATSNKNRVLFWLGNTVVDANFSRIGAMSGSELRELASQIPVPDGNKALAPPVLFNLPQTSLERQSTHYAVGPAGYAGGGGVLPPDLVGFDRGAEAVTAYYTLRSNQATLTIIDYPTPQMAAAQESKIRAYLKAGSQAHPAWPKPLVDSDQASLEVRRSGPLVAIVSGDAIPEESHKLLALVHFETALTSVPQPMESEVAKTGKLLIGITVLVLIGAGAAILLGFFLGGGRALYRMARGKPVSSVFDEEFIRLNLRD
ncbi:MAG: hypothetical protein P4K86_02490 [Terracidiphilus sp.]|nr:hypothetical protein [Terracidiphilus sp.]MDR3776362.1 hypothetical protein [Terracidiphilus sp.]